MVSAETGAAVQEQRAVELDGLRGVAVLAVVVGHVFQGTLDRLATYGVEMFFVLSGFLITGLLLRDGVDLRRFYGRRFRRLMPALWLLLATVGLWQVATGGGLVGVLAGVSYVSNLGRVAGVDLRPLEHLWSLAVEEHFYLLWPVVVLVCRDARRVLRVAMVGAVASLLWRWALLDEGWARVYNATDTRLSGILLGCALAAAVQLGLRGGPQVVGVVLVSVAVMLDPLRFGLAVCAVGAALLILSRPAWLGHPALRWFGGISYALYLWHGVFMWADNLSARLALTPIAIGIAYASTRWWESRFRSEVRAHHLKDDPATLKGEVPGHGHIGAERPSLDVASWGA